jgi:hypothetical protein
MLSKRETSEPVQLRLRIGMVLFSYGQRTGDTKGDKQPTAVAVAISRGVLTAGPVLLVQLSKDRPANNASDIGPSTLF